MACVDFKKAFDSVSHAILEKKLKNSFGFEGNLLAWVKSYMNRRKQFTIVNGNVSTKLPIIVLFTNDLPSKITESTVYMYADDTTLFCIGRGQQMKLSSRSTLAYGNFTLGA